MKYTFLLLVLSLFLLSCKSNPFECKASLSDEELIKKFGKPETDTLVLTSESSLYEYQNGLLKFYGNLKPTDSISIVEKTWTAPPFRLVRWYDSADKEPIDCLTWNTDKQKF